VKFGLVAVWVVLAAALAIRVRRRRAPDRRRTRPSMASINSEVGLVAARELRERFRGRVFKIGTLFILLVVAAAIVIPVLQQGKQGPQRIGVVGTLPASLRASVDSTVKEFGIRVRMVPEADAAHARADLGSGRIDLAIVDGRQLIVKDQISPSDVSASAQAVRALARNLGIAEAVQAAHLTHLQARALALARALPVSSIHPGKAKQVNATSLIGAILIFVMLSQYNTWTLFGVMEEKSSRVIEVLLSAVRPIHLLTGKVLGIGLAALAQASLIVVFALALSKGVGSNLLHGTAPLVIVTTLVWLVLGYAFYSWVYAAAGSMVERQDQVQTLVLPLSLPMLFGYIMAITGASSGSPSLLLKVLAYLPPTAPFAMPVLVGSSAVTWWEFLGSALVSVACTIGVARMATTIYRRAILRTGARVRLREVFARVS
jgi:ABC-2 type transport system permease protein